jgi:DHA1 family multidrug resistance protein-like MFS transporter
MTPKGRFKFLDNFRSNEAFLILCVQVFILHIGMSLIAPILPLYAQEFDVSTTLVGFLLTSQAIPRIFTSLPAGRLADRVGANRLLAAAAGIVTLSALLAGLAPNYGFLLMTRLLQGFGSAISQTAGLTYTANVSDKGNRARYMSIYQGSFLLGNSFGPAIGGITAEAFGYRAPFFIYSAVAFLVGLWMLLRLPDPRRVDEEIPSPVKHKADLIGSMKSIVFLPGVFLVSLIGFFAAYTRAGSRNMALPLLGEELGLTESQIGLTMTVIFIMTVISLYFVGALADRFGTKAIIVPSWLIIPIGLILLPLAENYSVFMLAAIIYGLASGAGSPVPVAYVANIVDDKSQGLALGFFRTLQDFGMLLGPVLMGWIGDHSSIANGVYVNAGMIFFVAVLFYIFAPTPKNERIDPQQAEGHSTEKLED